MRAFLLSKPGIVSLCAFAILMGFVLVAVQLRSRARAAALNLREPRPATSVMGNAPGAQQIEAAEGNHGERKTAPAGAGPEKQPANGKWSPVKLGSTDKRLERGNRQEEIQENLSFLDESLGSRSQSNREKDRLGRSLTRRRTATSTQDGQSETTTPEKAGPRPKNLRLRLLGQGKATTRRNEAAAGETTPSDEAGRSSDRAIPSQEHNSLSASEDGSVHRSTAEPAVRRMAAEESDPLCFCPYGRPIKCELVFTLDSTMEETPIIALVMEPVYNNGRLVIPAGAELHGLARPDRLRDRIFSCPDWVLLFPRDGSLPNGRELHVRGLALDREEPTSTGLTWGITDGSNGLQGEVIRTLESEEVKRFAAGFISAAALGLQEREGTGRNGSRYSGTPTNAALQGVSATMEDIARKISQEVERHGVFIRVPGGKQFYFYPQQAIHPWRARLPRPPGNTEHTQATHS